MDLSGLNNFKNKLNKLQYDIKDKVAEEIAEYGIEIANDKYRKLKQNIDKPKLTKETNGIGKRKIIASGIGLNFEEYGTGTRGEQSPYPELPKTGIPITGNWQYNYPSEFKKRNKQGGIYWTYKDEDGYKSSIGMPSGRQMYDTSKELKREVKEIVKNILKG